SPGVASKQDLCFPEAQVGARSAPELPRVCLAGKITCCFMSSTSSGSPGSNGRAAPNGGAASRTVAVREKAVTIATELGGKALHSTEHWMLKYSVVPT